MDFFVMYNLMMLTETAIFRNVSKRNMKGKKKHSKLFYFSVKVRSGISERLKERCIYCSLHQDFLHGLDLSPRRLVLSVFQFPSKSF